MGDYADMCMERDWNNWIDSVDRYYSDDYDPSDNPFDDCLRGGSSDTLHGKKKIAYKDFPDGDSILLRREGGTLNRECTIVRKTAKAVLFKIDCKVEDDLKHDYLFWMPKSVIFMLDGELKVYYLKHWADIKDISSQPQVQKNYRIRVTERREDSEDWTSSHFSVSHWFEGGVYTSKAEAEAEAERLQKEKPLISYGGFDFGELTYEVITV